MTKREDISKPELGMMVYHEKLYDGNELMEIVGIRQSTIELRGDYSGGTHNVDQSDWMPIKGAFRLRKVCEHHEKNGSCPLPNIHCSFPQCEPYVTKQPFQS